MCGSMKWGQVPSVGKGSVIPVARAESVTCSFSLSRLALCVAFMATKSSGHCDTASIWSQWDVY